MDEYYMRQALALAERGLGRTRPNPMVGAVIVRDNTVVGQGWHKKAGTPHAEIHALTQAGDLARGATLYVTLEPCSHYGRTGPCADAVIQAGIKKVVVAMVDPNPLVAGKGLEKLRAAGIEVVEGILAGQAAGLNEVFIKWVTTGMPFGILKTAMTLDGKIATVSGQSQWITGPPARQFVHTLRDRYDGILVGIGTVLADDPALTARLPQATQNPVRIVADSLARTPLTAKVVNDEAATIVAVLPEAPPERREALQKKGVDVVVVPRGKTGIDLKSLFQILGKRGISSILIEGGPAVNQSALAANVVDKVYWFIAPKIIGGTSAPGPVGGEGISCLDAAILLKNTAIQQVGEDVLVSGYIV
ncbi:riboflavin biosynthesis protein ribd [Lucifera butyrica]|uniref:Riboflavin biosynthesis protein RibD n=1 Tax=Lucifera butyrica TaxID=1351585 RepID=A0A498RCY7_9FIRM|nr:bifunctional diaminohydroxyphosphoribosylaminopyrimidine deaminase/5-amino-6-(5-phosphoribosylamino)uracil reductase RibD [Lucifera butyrica]VBB07933.1 riboflavin biosynthesis protein ribd [Lucifera butyrica]